MCLVRIWEALAIIPDLDFDRSFGLPDWSFGQHVLCGGPKIPFAHSHSRAIGRADAGLTLTNRVTKLAGNPASFGR